MRIRLAACLVIGMSILGSSVYAEDVKKGDAAASHEKDVEALRKAIIRSGEAFNASDPDAIMSQYARDIVLSYPGLPDMDYDTLVKAYGELRHRKPGVTEKTSPTIDEILVSGDLGVIRLGWTTITTETDPPRQSTRHMKDLQIWRRESDGTWKFIRGMHYRIPEPKPEAASR